MTRPVIQQWAGHYITNMQWTPVPLLAREKKCVVDGWEARTFGLGDFRDGANIGLRSVNGLVVLDDDFPTPAVDCADDFLPRTGAVYGRPRKPRSKRLYLVPDLTDTLTLTDIDNTHLVQLRVGLQDMAPPSIHPDTQERLAWDGLLLKPERVERARLVDGARYYWTARLLAKYWPARGRHDLRLAYARVLLADLQIPDHAALRILEWACRLGGSDRNGQEDASQAISSTKAKLASRQPTRGGRSVAELLPVDHTGQRIVRLLRKAYGTVNEAAEAIEELNQKHAIVWEQSGSIVVLTEDVEDGQPHLRFSRPSDMALLYPDLIPVGTKRNGEPTLKPRGTVWVTHADRRFYRGLEVAPNGRGNPGYYNMWRGFSVEPKRGDWSLFRQHLDLVANHDPDHAQYILAWMAETVQRPDRPIGISLAFKGEQGTGKSTFAKWFGKLFGVHFLHVDSEQHLLGRFNGHLHNAIVVLADEAVWAGSKAGLGALKRMITEDTLNIERKNVNMLSVKNMIHMLVASNEKWVVPTGFDNRRFAIFGTSTKRKNDQAFFGAVQKELDSGGLAALLYDLLEFKSDVDLRRIPETRDLQEQKRLSADPEEAWWLEKLHLGYLQREVDEDGDESGAYVWPTTILKVLLHDDYLKFLKDHNLGSRSARSTQTQLGMFLRDRTPLGDGQRQLIAGEQKRSWRVPPLDACRRAWAQACGWPEDYSWE